MALIKKCISEGLGAFAIVFIGCGSIIVSQMEGSSISHLGISLAFGLTVASFIYAVGHISGAHFNPAVTVAFWVTGYFPRKEVLPYVIAQCLGACVASVFHKYFLVQKIVTDRIINYGVTRPFDGEYFTAFIWELLLTGLLMFVIVAVATDSRAISKIAGLTIGSVVAINAFFAGPLSGASMNPSRSLGPALVAGDFHYLSAYFLGPILGAILGAWLYHTIKCAGGEKSEVKGCC